MSRDERSSGLGEMHGDRERPFPWALYQFCRDERYLAALAVEGSGTRLVWRSPVSTGRMQASGKYHQGLLGKS